AGLLTRLDVGVAAPGELIDAAAEDRVKHGRAAQRGGLDRVGARAYDVDWRMRLLERLRDHSHFGNRVVAPFEREPLLGPGLEHDGPALLEALAGLDLRHPGPPRPPP